MTEIPRTLEEALESFWQDAKAVMLSKRRMRGPDNIAAQGLYGVVTRVVEDKMARIKRTVGDMDLRRRLCERGVPQDVIDEYVPRPPDEAGEELEDDFIDAANYYIICWLLWQDWWELPLAPELPREPLFSTEDPRHIQRGEPLEGDCPECGVHFATGIHSYDKERPFDGRCPGCTKGYGPGWRGDLS